MKFLLKTDYESSEYLDGSFTLIELPPKEARRILKLRTQAVAFMKANTKGSARLRVDFRGVMRVFDDYEETLRETASLNEGTPFVRVPDDFEIPADCAQGRIELETINVHHDGELWLEATSQDSGDYLETNVPLEVFELAAKL